MNKQQAIVFFGILLAGLGISVFSLNQCGKKVAVVENAPADPGSAPGKDPATPGSAKPAPAPEPVKPAPAPSPAPTPAPAAGGFTTPAALMGALVETIRQRDVAGFTTLAGPEAIGPEIRPQVESLLKSPDWSPRSEVPATELAKSVDSLRWTIHFQKGGGAATELFVDISDKAVDPVTREVSRGPWQVNKVALPFDFAAKTGLGPTARPMPPGETPPGTPPAPPATVAGAPGKAPLPSPAAPIDARDALTVAHAFSTALVDRNFELARQLTDSQTVTAERLAALMIALEEGAFRLREEKPFVVTLARDGLTWVLTRVDSESAASEFVMEMGRDVAVGTEWKVRGLTFSKLIAALAAQAGAGGVAYAPIVSDPKGGDSLVLYFEFDEEGLSLRSQRQLRIVAGILRQGASRKIEINGHADAMGTDGYNAGLSDRRAAAIRAKLVEFGAAPDQVVTKAFGEAMPRRPNYNPDGTDNPDNRSQNRRAEVYLDF